MRNSKLPLLILTPVFRKAKDYGFDDFMMFDLISPSKEKVSLKLLKRLIFGKTPILIQGSIDKIIKCRLKYNDPWDGVMPVVKFSNHRRFVVGTRFDFGFLCCAVKDDYSVFYNF